MPSPPRILAFAGSAREGSWNRKVVAIVAIVAIVAGGARAAGAEVTLINLGDYPLPLYDGDVEARDGLPEAALELKQLFADHDGFIISTPEYNSSIPPLLKNSIDWASRPADGKPGMLWARGKVAAIVSASPGALGGMRALDVVRGLIGNIGIVVIAQKRAVGGVAQLFDDAGAMTDEKTREGLESVGAALAETAQRLKG